MIRWMIGLAVLGIMAIAASGRFRVALAFAVGAALGVLNFHWLWKTGRALMDAQTARVPRITVVLLVLRYPLCFAGLFVLYVTHWLSPLPLTAGLLVACGGVFLESLFLVRADLGGKHHA
jgi:hypothetical protein